MSVVKKTWSTDLAIPGANAVEPWMLELAKMLILNDLPTGVIVGSAVITECKPMATPAVTAADDESADSQLTTPNSQLPTLYEWHLGDVERAKRLRKPKGHPQPVWFTPFG